MECQVLLQQIRRNVQANLQGKLRLSVPNLPIILRSFEKRPTTLSLGEDATNADTCFATLFLTSVGHTIVRLLLRFSAGKLCMAVVVSWACSLASSRKAQRRPSNGCVTRGISRLRSGETAGAIARARFQSRSHRWEIWPSH